MTKVYFIILILIIIYTYFIFKIWSYDLVDFFVGTWFDNVRYPKRFSLVTPLKAKNSFTDSVMRDNIIITLKVYWLTGDIFLLYYLSWRTVRIFIDRDHAELREDTESALELLPMTVHLRISIVIILSYHKRYFIKKLTESSTIGFIFKSDESNISYKSKNYYYNLNTIYILGFTHAILIYYIIRMIM